MILASRILLAVLAGLGAFQLGASLDLSSEITEPWHYLAWAAMVAVAALVGWLVGGAVGRLIRGRLRAIERAADSRSAAELTVGALGLVVGLAAAVLGGVAVAQLPVIGPYLFLPVLLLVAYVFSRIAARRHVDILRLVGIRSRRAEVTPRLIDTSAIIDGRLVDIMKTRFLTGPVVVPSFVLDELQAIADSGDPMKRARGRRGLDLVRDMKSTANGGFSVREADADLDDDEVVGVDAKLVRMARADGAAIVTTDYNLNKVAEIHGVEVLNVNDLANALKPAVLPGEPLAVRIIREGKEFGQGVGYLDDGTMIVVEDGRKHLGTEITVEVTSVLQNPSGKMIFTRIAQGDD